MATPTKTDETIQLYRYLSAEAAIKTIENRSLRVGRLREFNDPFESRLGIDRIEQLSPREVENEKKLNEGLLDFLNEQHGILCCSSVLDDPVLWSHYAASHYGIVIEVKCIRNHFNEVKYDDPSLPKVPAHYRLNYHQYRDELKAIFTKLLTQKSPTWSYEKEWRGGVELSSCRVAGGMYFKDISGDDITRVIIGCRSVVTPNYVRRALETNGWRNVPVEKAKLSLTEYKIECEQC